MAEPNIFVKALAAIKAYLDKPVSLTVDVLWSVAVGVGIFIVLIPLRSLPLGDALQPTLTGIGSALFLIRARANHPLNAKA